MAITDLSTFKSHIRELSNDLDDAFQLALASATSEVVNYLGFDPYDEYQNDIPGDIVMGCMLLAQVHADATNDPERYTQTAYRLLRPYRDSIGIRAA